MWQHPKSETRCHLIFRTSILAANSLSWAQTLSLCVSLLTGEHYKCWIWLTNQLKTFHIQPSLPWMSSMSVVINLNHYTILATISFVFVFGYFLQVQHLWTSTHRMQKFTCAMPVTILLPDTETDAAASTSSLLTSPCASRVLVWASWTNASVARFTAFPAFYTCIQMAAAVINSMCRLFVSLLGNK